ncbi:MAG: CapA family protein [Candidatus Marinimicrobia bacterium]|nr:CapA family protein [Candidatus Neomarinimicrobiota bacterium]MCF7922592.1 CapA family protein [Candidatus Neomarinimicrobiota bacterium]
MNSFIRLSPILLIILLVSVGFAEEKTIRIKAVGDIMLGSYHPDGFLRPDEKGSILKYIRPLLQDADITLGNLEGTLCDSGSTDKCEPDSLDCYVFRMPEIYGEDLQSAGFDFISLANNHIGDFGQECVTRTEIALENQEIGWSGRPGTYASKNVGGVRVAFIAFHSGGYCNSSLDLETAAAMVSNLTDDHDLVLVSVHGGAEGLAAMHLPDSSEYYLGEPRGHLMEFSHKMIDAGADLVVGHGPHVARAIEIYKGKLVAYSLANFATYGRFNLQKERRFGAILDVELSQSGDLIGAKIISTEQKYWGVPFVDTEHRFSHLVDSLSAEDLPLSGARFKSDGSLILH